jgi:hypothetical protein
VEEEVSFKRAMRASMAATDSVRAGFRERRPWYVLRMLEDADG